MRAYLRARAPVDDLPRFNGLISRRAVGAALGLSETLQRCPEVEAEFCLADKRSGYVNNVLKGKLLESEALATQARNNSKSQFASSPTLDEAILDAVMDALEAHQTMSKQALDSARVRAGLKSILLGPAELYEALRSRAADSGRPLD